MSGHLFFPSATFERAIRDQNRQDVTLLFQSESDEVTPPVPLHEIPVLTSENSGNNYLVLMNTNSSSVHEDEDEDEVKDYIPESLASFLAAADQTLAQNQREFLDTTPCGSDLDNFNQYHSDDGRSLEADWLDDTTPILLEEDENDRQLRGEILGILERKKELEDKRLQEEKEKHLQNLRIQGFTNHYSSKTSTPIEQISNIEIATAEIPSMSTNNPTNNNTNSAFSLRREVVATVAPTNGILEATNAQRDFLEIYSEMTSMQNEDAHDTMAWLDESTSLKKNVGSPVLLAIEIGSTVPPIPKSSNNADSQHDQQRIIQSYPSCGTEQSPEVNEVHVPPGPSIDLQLKHHPATKIQSSNRHLNTPSSVLRLSEPNIHHSTEKELMSLFSGAETSADTAEPSRDGVSITAQSKGTGSARKVTRRNVKSFYSKRSPPTNRSRDKKPLAKESPECPLNNEGMSQSLEALGTSTTSASYCLVRLSTQPECTPIKASCNDMKLMPIFVNSGKVSSSNLEQKRHINSAIQSIDEGERRQQMQISTPTSASLQFPRTPISVSSPRSWTSVTPTILSTNRYTLSLQMKRRESRSCAVKPSSPKYAKFTSFSAERLSRPRPYAMYPKSVNSPLLKRTGSPSTRKSKARAFVIVGSSSNAPLCSPRGKESLRSTAESVKQLTHARKYVGALVDNQFGTKEELLSQRLYNRFTLEAKLTPLKKHSISERTKSSDPTLSIMHHLERTSTKAQQLQSINKDASPLCLNSAGTLTSTQGTELKSQAAQLIIKPSESEHPKSEGQEQSHVDSKFAKIHTDVPFISNVSPVKISHTNLSPSPLSMSSAAVEIFSLSPDRQDPNHSHKMAHNGVLELKSKVNLLERYSSSADMKASTADDFTIQKVSDPKYAKSGIIPVRMSTKATLFENRKNEQGKNTLGRREGNSGNRVVRQSISKALVEPRTEYRLQDPAGEIKLRVGAPVIVPPLKMKTFSNKVNEHSQSVSDRQSIQGVRKLQLREEKRKLLRPKVESYQAFEKCKTKPPSVSEFLGSDLRQKSSKTASGKENEIVSDNMKGRSNVSHVPEIQSKVKRIRRPLTIPQGPKFATDARLGPKTAVHARDTPNPSESFEKGLRHDDLSIGSRTLSKKAPTVPTSPKFSKHIKDKDKPVTIFDESKNFTLAQSSDILRKALRKDNQSASCRSSGLTIPAAPKFQSIPERVLPKSSEQLDLEEIERYKANPFKAKALPKPKSMVTSNVKARKTKRPLTIPEPFTFRSEGRITGQKTSVEDQQEKNKHFQARPMPSFSQSKRGMAGVPRVISRPVTTPEPFAFGSDSDRSAVKVMSL